MKFKFSRIIFFISVVAFLSSCLSSSDTEVSTDAHFYSLTFASDDSVPNISSTTFKLIEVNNATHDSIITNLDSIAYNSDVDDVIATFSFKSSNAAYYVYEDTHDTIALTSGTDTIDFNRQPITVINYATDGTSVQKYKLDVRIHKVDPKLYVWKKLESSPTFHDDALNQRLIAMGDNLYYFINTGSKAYVNISSDEGQSWQQTELTTFPMTSSLSAMTEFNGMLYVAGDGKYYRSANGTDWGEFTDADYEFSSMLYVLNAQIWSITKSKTDGKYRFSSSTNGTTWAVRGEIPANSLFPIKDFNAASFLTKVGTTKVVLQGGVSRSNDPLNTRCWSSEDGLSWYLLSIENKTLDTLAAGSTMAYYDRSMLLLGRHSSIDSIQWKQSIDEGLSWIGPDTSKNQLWVTNIVKRRPLQADTVIYTSPITPTFYPTMAVLRPVAKWDSINDAAKLYEIQRSNKLFIIGGKDAKGNFSKEVWKGKKNKLNFLRQTTK